MTSTLRHISFRRLGTSEVHQRYLEDDRDLGGFLGMRARSVAELVRRAPTGAGRLLPREALVKALRAYATKHQAPPEVLANAEALLDTKVHAVVTGQQPGLLGGPLFTFHKVARVYGGCADFFPGALLHVADISIFGDPVYDHFRMFDNDLVVKFQVDFRCHANVEMKAEILLVFPFDFRLVFGGNGISKQPQFLIGDKFG